MSITGTTANLTIVGMRMRSLLLMFIQRTQYSTEQYSTEQNRTEQNRTEQNAREIADDSNEIMLTSLELL
jgi:hypothetical protein